MQWSDQLEKNIVCVRDKNKVTTDEHFQHTRFEIRYF